MIEAKNCPDAGRAGLNIIALKWYQRHGDYGLSDQGIIRLEPDSLPGAYMLRSDYYKTTRSEKIYDSANSYA